MAIRKRILLLLSLLALAFVAGTFGWRELEARQARLLSQGARRDKVVFAERLIALQGESLATLAYDYTYWDEMVHFVRTGDKVWATENLETCISTFKATHLWVFSPQRRLVYSAVDKGVASVRLPAAPALLERCLGKPQRFCHFFVNTPAGLMEVRGATIHGTADHKRKGAVHGYFLVGRLWDKDVVRKVADLTGCRVLLQNQDGRGSSHVDPPSVAGDGRFVFDLPLPGPDGARTAALHFHGASPVVPLVRRSTAKAILLFVVFTLSLLALTFAALFYWVTLPLAVIARSLRQNDPAALGALSRATTEFGELARLAREFFAQQDALRAAKDEMEDRVRARTRELADAYDATMEGWSRALDLRDKETEGHSQRVTELTLRLARALGVRGDALVHIRRGALLHDIGKLGVPDSILLKPGPLTRDEQAIMYRHPTYARDMIAPIAFLRPALDIPYCHHERWDGTGYPRGLTREAIPLAARIFAVVDVWDALRSERPYRAGWPDERVREHIRQGSGTHFDPAVVDAFLRIVAEATETTNAAPHAPAPERYFARAA